MLVIRQYNGLARREDKGYPTFRLALPCFRLFLALSAAAISAQTPTLESLTCDAESLLPKESVSCLITLTRRAPAEGFVVLITSDSPMIHLPVMVTVNEADLTTTFSAVSSETATEEQTTLRAFAGGVERQTSVWLLSATTPFLLIAKGSGKCLDVRGGSVKGGAAIQQWGCWGGENQNWFLKPDSDGTYEIESAESKLPLAIVGESRRAGARATLSELHSNFAVERWRLRRDALGYYNLVAASSEMCLDVSGGAWATENGVRVQQWPCIGIDSQAWALVSRHRVELRWDRSTTPDVSGYFVYRATDENGHYTKLSGRLVETDYIDGNVIPGGTYYYAATAIDTHGREGRYSNRVKVVIPKP